MPVRVGYRIKSASDSRNKEQIKSRSSNNRKKRKAKKNNGRVLAWIIAGTITVYGGSQLFDHFGKTTPLLDEKNNVYGFITAYENSDKSYANMINRLEASTEFGVMDGYITASFSMNSEGKIVNVLGQSAPHETIESINKSNKKALALVNNFDIVGWENSREIAESILKDKEKRTKFVKSFVKICKENKYAGGCLDFENIKPESVQAMNEFVTELKEAFSRNNLYITVCVPIKYHDNMNQGYEYDYISKVSDGMIIMNYDETNYGAKKAGPVSSAPMTQKVVDYVCEKVQPEDKNKVLIGLATYGRIWSNKEKGDAAGIENIEKLIEKYKLPVLWDDKNQVPYVDYKDPRQGYGKRKIYFENEKSLKIKMDMVNNAELGGVGTWRIGLQSEKYINALEREYAENKNNKQDSEQQKLGMMRNIKKHMISAVKSLGSNISDEISIKK